MNGTGRAPDSTTPVDEGDTVRVQCKVGRRVPELDVRWTTGAVFEFDSVAAARAWVADQNHHVPGTLFLAEAPAGGGPLAVDYHVKYTGGR